MNKYANHLESNIKQMLKAFNVNIQQEQLEIENFIKKIEIDQRNTLQFKYDLEKRQEKLKYEINVIQQLFHQQEEPPQVTTGENLNKKDNIRRRKKSLKKQDSYFLEDNLI